MSSLKQNETQPPRFARILLSIATPKQHKNYVLGDIHEEFLIRAKVSNHQANRWYWQQSFASTHAYLKRAIESEQMRFTASLFIGCILFLTLGLLVMWLSTMDNVDGYSAGFWHELLNGNVHLALIEPQFWQEIPDYWRKSTDAGFSHFVSMFIDVPAFLVACISFIMLKNLWSRDVSKGLFCLSTCALLFTPYLLGLWLLNTTPYDAKQVGPIIALMILSTLYTVLPACWLIGKRLCQRQQVNWS